MRDVRALPVGAPVDVWRVPRAAHRARGVRRAVARVTLRAAARHARRARRHLDRAARVRAPRCGRRAARTRARRRLRRDRPAVDPGAATAWRRGGRGRPARRPAPGRAHARGADRRHRLGRRRGADRARRRERGGAPAAAGRDAARVRRPGSGRTDEPRRGVPQGAVRRRLALGVACVLPRRGRPASDARAPRGDDSSARPVHRGRRALSPRRCAQGRLHAVKAARLYAPGDLRVEDVPRPEPGPGDVLVEIEVALTDGTDLKTYRRGHPVLLSESPAPFGHEFCGIVNGRRVVAANSAPCGECDGCTRGEQCRALSFLSGAYADWIVVPERIAAVNLHEVPAGVAPEVAAMVEPLACCLRGVERAGVHAGDTVAILGAGPIGLMLAACVADAGGWPVIVGGREERRALVDQFGAESGAGTDADIVIEAAGSDTAWIDAIELVRPGGTVVMFGGLPRDARPPIDAYRLHYEELTVRGSFHHSPATVRAALGFLASGAYPWERLVTHRVALAALPALFADPPRDLLKAAVVP